MWYQLGRLLCTMNSTIFTVLLIVISLASCINAIDDIDPLSDEFIEFINSNQTLWRAGRNFGEDVPMSHLKKLLGHRPMKVRSGLDNFSPHAIVDIPESFDWRDYSNCTSLRTIRDQGCCGSCWAFAAVEAISDRICIHSGGIMDVYISANDVVSCCLYCGKGCNGGDPLEAFVYWITQGIVSGGPYGSTEGCSPYKIPPLGNYCIGESPTPKCDKSCKNGAAYDEDLYFGKSAYIVPNSMAQIQAEIMLNGPVAASFNVYEDIMLYKSGVYKYTAGKHLSGHAIKILGWGVENDTPYWLIANSWSVHFGEKGYMKMLRGENHCEIENRAVAGIPR